MDNSIFKVKKKNIPLHCKILYEQETIPAGCIMRLGRKQKQDLQKNNAALNCKQSKCVSASDVLCKETR